MKCKQAEKLIIEISQAELNLEIKAELDAHLLNCPKCAGFSENLNMIHQSIDKIKAPESSIKLLDKTTALCLSEIIEQSAAFSFASYYQAILRTPKFVRIALGAMLILTIIWAVPVLKDVINSQTFTYQSILVIAIVV